MRLLVVTATNAKQCIAKQHGIALELLSLGVAVQLDMNKSPMDYGIENGDFLSILKRTNLPYNIDLCVRSGERLD